MAGNGGYGQAIWRGLIWVFWVLFLTAACELIATGLAKVAANSTQSWTDILDSRTLVILSCAMSASLLVDLNATPGYTAPRWEMNWGWVIFIVNVLFGVVARLMEANSVHLSAFLTLTVLTVTALGVIVGRTRIYANHEGSPA